VNEGSSRISTRGQENFHTWGRKFSHVGKKISSRGEIFLQTCGVFFNAKDAKNIPLAPFKGGIATCGNRNLRS